MAKEEGLHTAVDTCGMVSWETFTKVLPVTDLFLYDVKQMDAALHQRYTGRDNRLSLSNLRHLCERDAEVEVRIPLVPSVNDDEQFVSAVGQFLSGLACIRRVKVLPYHPYARSKFVAIGREDTMPHVASPSDAELDRVVDRLRTFGIDAVSGRG